MELYAGVDVFFRLLPMPLGIKGFLLEDNQVYFIVINSNISHEGKQKALLHEINHLIYDDLNSEEDKEEIERRNYERSNRYPSP